MNKHQKKQSRQIKSWMRILNCYGYDVTYKQTRRRMRMLDRAFNEWVRHNLRLKHVYPWQYKLLFHAYVRSGLRFENPFMIRYLGKPWKEGLK